MIFLFFLISEYLLGVNFFVNIMDEIRLRNIENNSVFCKYNVEILNDPSWISLDQNEHVSYSSVTSEDVQTITVYCDKNNEIGPNGLINERQATIRFEQVDKCSEKFDVLVKQSGATIISKYTILNENMTMGIDFIEGGYGDVSKKRDTEPGGTGEDEMWLSFDNDNVSHIIEVKPRYEITLRETLYADYGNGTQAEEIRVVGDTTFSYDKWDDFNYRLEDMNNEGQYKYETPLKPCVIPEHLKMDTPNIKYIGYGRYKLYSKADSRNPSAYEMGDKSFRIMAQVLEGIRFRLAERYHLQACPDSGGTDCVSSTTKIGCDETAILCLVDEKHVQSVSYEFYFTSGSDANVQPEGETNHPITIVSNKVVDGVKTPLSTITTSISSSNIVTLHYNGYSDNEFKYAFDCSENPTDTNREVTITFIQTDGGTDTGKNPLIYTVRQTYTAEYVFTMSNVEIPADRCGGVKNYTYNVYCNNNIIARNIPNTVYVTRNDSTITRRFDNALYFLKPLTKDNLISTLPNRDAIWEAVVAQKYDRYDNIHITQSGLSDVEDEYENVEFVIDLKKPEETVNYIYQNDTDIIGYFVCDNVDECISNCLVDNRTEKIYPVVRDDNYRKDGAVKDGSHGAIGVDEGNIRMTGGTGYLSIMFLKRVRKGDNWYFSLPSMTFANENDEDRITITYPEVFISKGSLDFIETDPEDNHIRYVVKNDYIKSYNNDDFSYDYKLGIYGERFVNPNKEYMFIVDYNPSDKYESQNSNVDFLEQMKVQGRKFFSITNDGCFELSLSVNANYSIESDLKLSPSQIQSDNSKTLSANSGYNYTFWEETYNNEFISGSTPCPRGVVTVPNIWGMPYEVKVYACIKEEDDNSEWMQVRMGDDNYSIWQDIMGSTFPFTSGHTYEISINEGEVNKPIVEYYCVSKTQPSSSSPDWQTTAPSQPVWQEGMEHDGKIWWCYSTVGDTSSKYNITELCDCYIEDGDRYDNFVGFSGNNYYIMSSNNTTPQSGDSRWSETIPPITSTNKYLFIRKRVRYYEGGPNYRHRTKIVGTNELEYTNPITTYYLASSQNTGITTASTGWNDSIPSSFSLNNRYLWSYNEIVFGDGTIEKTYPTIITEYTKPIREISIYLLASELSDGVTTGDTGWVNNTIPSISESTSYIWQYCKITYNDSKTATTTPFVSLYLGGVTIMMDLANDWKHPSYPSERLNGNFDAVITPINNTLLGKFIVFENGKKGYYEETYDTLFDAVNVRGKNSVLSTFVQSQSDNQTIGRPANFSEKYWHHYFNLGDNKVKMLSIKKLSTNAFNPLVFSNNTFTRNKEMNFITTNDTGATVYSYENVFNGNTIYDTGFAAFDDGEEKDFGSFPYSDSATDEIKINIVSAITGYKVDGSYADPYENQSNEVYALSRNVAVVENYPVMIVEYQNNINKSSILFNKSPLFNEDSNYRTLRFDVNYGISGAMWAGNVCKLHIDRNNGQGKFDPNAPQFQQTKEVGLYSRSCGNVRIIANTFFNNNTGSNRTPRSIIIDNYNDNDRKVSIDSGAFSGLSALTYVEIKADVSDRIGDSVFKGCTGLSNVIINSNNIPSNTFSGCSTLEYVILGHDVFVNKSYQGIDITEYTGYVNSNLTDEEGSIGENAFYGCPNLKTLVLAVNNKVSFNSASFGNRSNLNKITILVPKKILNKYSGNEYKNFNIVGFEETYFGGRKETL